MSIKKEDAPNQGGNALGTNGVGTLSETNRDDELRTMRQDLSVDQAAPEPDFSPGGPEIPKTVEEEPRTSVT